MHSANRSALLALCVCVGCAGPLEEPLSVTPVGTAVDATVIPTAFNEARLTRVETTGGVFTVVGTVSVLKGARARLGRARDGRAYLRVDGSPYAWAVCE